MDDFENERDEQLIKEREAYEKEFFSQIVDEMIESDALDQLISDRLQYIDEHFDFEPSPEYQRLEELYYQQHDSMDSAYNCADFQEYIPNDDEFDNLDGYDYPEEPDENIEGVSYPEPAIDFEYEIDEPQFEDFIDIDEPVFNLDIPDEYYADLYNDLMEEINEDEDEKFNAYLDSLIKDHMNEEKEFLDNILVDAIQEDLYFERAIDELIFDQIDIDYEPNYFEYDEDEGYWYDDYNNPSDKLLTDPFDSLGDIDYPEGERSFRYKIPDENYYEEELQRDFEEYQRKKDKFYGFNEEDIPDPEDELILEPPEDVILEYEDIDEKRNEDLIKNQEKIESAFKDYFTKDDTLDKIIKEKLKEKKFKK